MVPKFGTHGILSSDTINFNNLHYIYRKHFQQSVVVRLPYTPFVTYTFHYILGNYFHNLHLILPCVSFYVFY